MMETILNCLQYGICLYLLAVNVIAFGAYGIDKRKAVKDKWRIPEKTLLLLAVFGGSIGALLGMHAFHHKTRKNKFRIGVPLILVLQVTAVCAVWMILGMD